MKNMLSTRFDPPAEFDEFDFLNFGDQPAGHFDKLPRTDQEERHTYQWACLGLECSGDGLSSTFICINDNTYRSETSEWRQYAGRMIAPGLT